MSILELCRCRIVPCVYNTLSILVHKAHDLFWACTGIFHSYHAGFRVSCVGWVNSGPTSPDSKVHGAYMGLTWVLSAPDGPHVGPMNLAIKVGTTVPTLGQRLADIAVWAVLHLIKTSFTFDIKTNQTSLRFVVFCHDFVLDTFVCINHSYFTVIRNV